MVAKKYNPLRWFRYLLRKNRINSIKVYSDIRRKQEIINYYLTLAESKYGFIKDLSLYTIDKPDIVVLLSPRFRIPVSAFKEEIAKEFVSMTYQFCDAIGHRVSAGYSNINGTEMYFYSITGGEMISDIICEKERLIWGYGNIYTYNKKLKEYINKFL